MAKAIEDHKHAAVLTKPLRVRRYERRDLPDPGQMVDCIIAVNDRTDAAPSHLAYSDGSTWHMIPLMGDIRPVAAPAPHVDVTPLVRQTVQEMLPAPVVQALPAPVADDEFRQDMARTVLAMSDTINELQRRVQYLETHALKDTDKVHAEFLRQAG